MKKFVAAALGGASMVAAQCPPEFGALCSPTSAEMTAVAPKVFRAEFETTEGNFVVEVTRNLAPKEADRFYSLVRNGYYDDTRFYRVVSPFVVQWGPSGNPALANVYNPTKCDVPGACFRSSPVIGANLKGTITFSAESAADTCEKNPASDVCAEAAGTGPLVLATELFINLKDNVHLDASGFGSFGEVVEGMEVVEALYNGYGEMHGGSLGEYLCTRDMASLHYPDAACSGPNPDMLYSMEGGNTYYDSEFPLLDRITKASIVEPTTAAGEGVGHETATVGDAVAHEGAAATDAAHATADAATAHGTEEDAHASGGSGRVPPENPQWPVAEGVTSSIIGMSVIAVLVLAGTAGVLAWLWIRAKKRGPAISTSDTEFGAESAINMGSFSEK